MGTSLRKPSYLPVALLLGDWGEKLQYVWVVPCANLAGTANKK